MFLPCDSWGRKDNSEKTEKFCNLSRRLHVHPFGAPAGKRRAGAGRGAHLVEVGHRYRAAWGSQSESVAGLRPRLPNPTGHPRCWSAETVSPDSPGKSGAKEAARALPTSARMLVSRAVPAAPRLGAPSRGRGRPGQLGGDAGRRGLFHRSPENVDQPRPSHAATTRPPQLPPGRNLA